MPSIEMHQTFLFERHGSTKQLTSIIIYVFVVVVVLVVVGSEDI